MDPETPHHTSAHRCADPVTVVTIDRLPRQPVVVAQVLRALSEHGIPIDVLVAGRHHQYEQLVITVGSDRAAEVVELASTVAHRFGVGPVTSESAWAEVTVEAPEGRPAGEVLAEVYERLAQRGIETRMVAASGSTVSCLVREERVDELLALAGGSART